MEKKQKQESGAIHFNPIFKVRAGLPIVQNKVRTICPTRMYYMVTCIYIKGASYILYSSVLLAKCPVSLCWNRAQMRFLTANHFIRFADAKVHTFFISLKIILINLSLGSLIWVLGGKREGARRGRGNVNFCRKLDEKICIL